LYYVYALTCANLDASKHFTHIIWKSTSFIGCNLTIKIEAALIVFLGAFGCVNCHEARNVGGDYKNNVFQSS